MSVPKTDALPLGYARTMRGMKTLHYCAIQSFVSYGMYSTRNAEVCQQKNLCIAITNSSIKLPQFTDLATFALQLAQAYTTWRSPKTGEDALSYFSHTPRYTGDEHELRASLIRERILPAFHYTPEHIEYESTERFDLVLRSVHQQNSRRIAIIETKSSSNKPLRLPSTRDVGNRQTPFVNIS